MEGMSQTSIAVTNGNSLAVNLRLNIVQALGIQKGDMIEIKLRKTGIKGKKYQSIF